MEKGTPERRQGGPRRFACGYVCNQFKAAAAKGLVEPKKPHGEHSGAGAGGQGEEALEPGDGGVRGAPSWKGQDACCDLQP